MPQVMAHKTNIPFPIMFEIIVNTSTATYRSIKVSLTNSRNFSMPSSLFKAQA